MTTLHSIDEENPLARLPRIIHRWRYLIIILFCFFTLVGVGSILHGNPTIQLTARYRIVPSSAPSNGDPYPASSLPASDYDSIYAFLVSDALFTKVCKASHIPAQALSVHFEENSQDRIITATITARTEKVANPWLSKLATVFNSELSRETGYNCANAINVLDERTKTVTRQLKRLAIQREFLLQKTASKLILYDQNDTDDGRNMTLSHIHERIKSERRVRMILISMLGKESQFITSVEMVSNPAMHALRERIRESELERAGLIILYKPEHVRIQQMDAAIGSMERELAEMPAYEKMLKKVSNPHYQYLRERELENRLELERLIQKEISFVKTDKEQEDIRREKREDAGELKKVEADIAECLQENQKLRRMISSLTLYMKTAHTPLRSITAKPDVKSLTLNPYRESAGSVLLSALFSIMIAAMADRAFHKVDSPGEAMKLLHADECVVAPDYTLSPANSADRLRLTSRRFMNMMQMESAGDADRTIHLVSWDKGSGKSFLADKLCPLLRELGCDAVVEKPHKEHSSLETPEGGRRSQYTLVDGVNLESVWRTGEMLDWSGMICFVAPHDVNTREELNRASIILDTVKHTRIILVYNRAPMDIFWSCESIPAQTHEKSGG